MSLTLEQLQAYIETTASPSELTKQENLATVIFDVARSEFLDQFDAAQLSSLVRRIIDFIGERVGPEPSVRMYNPDLSIHGWTCPHTALEVTLPDCPFLVDSIRNYLRREGVQLHHLIHPILNVERSKDGRIEQIYVAGSVETDTESYELFLIDQIEDTDRLAQLKAGVFRVLKDVKASTDDHGAMLSKCESTIGWLHSLTRHADSPRVPVGAAEIEEYVEFLSWLRGDNFIFLGYREYWIGKHNQTRCAGVVAGSGLGLLHDTTRSRYKRPIPVNKLPKELQLRMVGPPLLVVTKTNAESTVHRSRRIDYIGIKEFDDTGTLIGERRFLGLFTSKAYASSAKEIPILRKKLRQVLELARTRTGSHDYKEILNLFDSMPISELFWLSVDEIHRDLRNLMSVEEERDVRLFERIDPLRRGLGLMVIMPRERFNSDVRQRIQQFLAERVRATHVDYHLAMADEDESQVRFHFFFSTSMEIDRIDFNELDREVTELTRTWDDRLEERMIERFGPKRAELARRYNRVLTDGYKAEIPPENAARDIWNLESLENEPFGVDFVNPTVSRFPFKTTHLRIYHPGTVALADLFPILENFGLKVFEQISYQLSDPAGRKKVSYSIDIFRVQDSAGKRIEIDKDGARLREALIGVLNKEFDSDSLNRLVLSARLGIRQTALLSAYRGHLFQLSPATSLTFITRTMLKNPALVSLLCRYFTQKFDPDFSEERIACMGETEAEFLESLNLVASLPEDQILRFIFSIIKATVRSNYFLNRPYISNKVESRQLEKIPEPKPFFEIFVSSPKVEAIHLRGGRIARGGLRWSDRPDDFRTEVLGLMKTQMTKNSLIVPEGSKGGFVLKQPPADRKVHKQHVEVQYRTFIRGLLDLTDNIVDGRTEHPERLVIYDSLDPYLVVAADKGTATFSDIANEISSEYGFWLADAFASGGSHGYDHKKEGITARGAWECVRRHFLEMGINPKKDLFTVVGIGDMSGDVFGNGLLYSAKIKLLAAFNHQHIFVDPNPQPIKSFKERKRLFDDPSLSWEDYERSSISKGGGVFSRHSKAIKLTPEMRSLFEAQEETLSGPEIIKKILQMPVDLLWNGGIGTYVKATSERNSDVGDASNDQVRIDAPLLRAKVVGEGGNLGLTQLARIEYALHGGRINTDAIDNSGGVDMSDHEVNIKILLQPEVHSRRMPFSKRNALLEKMTSEVSKLVLRNNWSQSLCLSLAVDEGLHGLTRYGSLIQYMTKSGILKREVEFLPDQKVLDSRREAGKSLTRPEFAILMAYTKMGLKRALLSGALPDEQALQHHLSEYFPAALRREFSDGISQHPLSREIIATQMTNYLVDRFGVGFLHSLIEDSGVTPGDAIHALCASHEILNLQSFFEKLLPIEAKVTIDRQYDAIRKISESARSVSLWLIASSAYNCRLSDLVAGYQRPLSSMRRNLEGYVASEVELKRFRRQRQKALDCGFPRTLATEIAASGYFPSCLGVIDISRMTGSSLKEAATHFYAIGDLLGLGWLRDNLGKVKPRDQWEAVALTGLIMDLRFAQRELTVEYLLNRTSNKVTVKKHLSQRSNMLQRVQFTLRKIRSQRKLDLASGSVMTRQVLRLIRDKHEGQ